MHWPLNTSHLTIHMHFSLALPTQTSFKVDMIEEKLQLFINMYEEDRKRLHALTYAVPHPPPSTPCPDTPMSAISPPSHNNNSNYFINPHQMYSSISAGLQKLHNNPPPLMKQKSILQDSIQNNFNNVPVPHHSPDHELVRKMCYQQSEL